jgi:pyruvate/2-oxoglutarate dehydrogenase complex dihydrolipoamide dehydrogenase (E3) component
MEHFDAIVIGTGQSGPFLAVRLAKAGRKVAVLERAKFGGTCVNVGCIPTKTLVASARAAWAVRNAAEFGVQLDGGFHVDMKRVKARKDAIVRASTEGVESWLRKTECCTVITEQGRFVGPRRVRAGSRELEADQIFINVGARAAVPPLPGLDKVPFWTNTGMLEVDFLPPHLLILGGGYLALEFGQMYRRFGSEVTVVERSPRLMPREDDDVAAEVRAILEAEGIRFQVGADVQKVSGQIGALELHLGSGEVVRGTHLLVAVGRVPNTADLGLREAGIETDAHGYVSVDDQLRTTAPGVWALGDCNGKGAFTHTSYNDYEIVAANLLDGDSRRVSDRIPAYAIYIDPPLGRAGLNEAEVRKSGRRALQAKMPMSRVGRAKERSETRGFMKVLVDAGDKRILGAALLGIRCDEVVHLLIDAMHTKTPATVLTRIMHVHPTVAELIPTLLGELQPLA